jgi:hypothetical protein
LKLVRNTSDLALEGVLEIEVDLFRIGSGVDTDHLSFVGLNSASKESSVFIHNDFAFTRICASHISLVF